MAHWKTRVDFLLAVIELFLSLTVDVLQGKTCQNSLLFGEGGSVLAKISGEGVIPGEYFFLVSRKLDTCDILLSHSANCTVLRAVVLTQYRRVMDRRTDRQTDGRNCCS